MKKKIFCITTFIMTLIVIVISNKSYVHANIEVTKPLICVVGYEYNDLLEYSGYRVINGFIDYNHIGTYYLTYEEISTKKTYTKRIDVVKESELDNFYYQYETNNLVLKSSEIIDVCFNNDITYILSKENKNIYLSKLIDNIVQETVFVSNTDNNTLTKILADEFNIYIIGTIYTDTNSIDLYLLSYDSNLKKINENTIGGLGIDNVYDASLLGDYIYIGGSTTSSSGFFEGVRKQEDAFLLKVSKEFLYPEIIDITTTNFINEIKNVCVYEDNIYIVEQYSDGTNIKYNICSYNSNLELISKSYIENSYGLTVEKLVCCEDGVYLIAYQYNYAIEKYSSKVFAVNGETNIKLKYEYVNYDDANVRIIDYNIYNNKPHILMYDLYEEQTFIYLQEEKISICLEKTSIPIKFLNNPLIFINSNKQVTSYYYIYKKEDIMINGNLVHLSNRSNINKNTSYYGEYIDYYVYETDQLILAFPTIKIVDLDISVIDNEVFDLNLILKFNGQGKLNNESIESGYIVKTPGEYILEIIGHNNEKRIYSFSVKNLSNKTFEKNTNIELLSKDIVSSSEEITKTINFLNTQKKEIKSKYYYGILLAPASLLIFLLIFLLGGKKSEK